MGQARKSEREGGGRERERKGNKDGRELSFFPERREKAAPPRFETRIARTNENTKVKPQLTLVHLYTVPISPANIANPLHPEKIPTRSFRGTKCTLIERRCRPFSANGDPTSLRRILEDQLVFLLLASSD